MNVEKLYAVSRRYLKIIEESEIRNILEGFIQSLESRVSEPGNANHQQVFSDSFTKLKQASASFPNTKLDPIELDILTELDATDALPQNVFSKVDQALSANPHTINAALASIKDFKTRFDIDIKNITNLSSAFDWFGISGYDVEKNTGQLLFQIPRKEIENRIDLLGNEISHLDRLTASFSELAYKDRRRATVAYLSSTEPIVVVVLGALAFKYLAEGIAKVIDAYSNLQTNQANIDALKKSLPKKVVDPMQTHLDTMIEDAISTYVDENVKSVGKQLPGGRLNELRSEIKSHLKQVAKRVDRGFQYQLALGEIDDSGDDVDGFTDEALKSTNQAVKTVADFKKIGQPLLRLEDQEDRHDGDEDN